MSKFKLRFAKSSMLQAKPLTKIDPGTFVATTCIPAFNIALTGDVDGGLREGTTQIVGKSKHFKSLLGLFLCKAYLDKYPDAELVFYDSEKGASAKYFESVGIDPTRVSHLYIDYVENLKFDMADKLHTISTHNKANPEDRMHVVFFIDSLGLLPSKKEVDDAHDAKQVADMTRAKAIASFARVCCLPAAVTGIPIIIINHIYAGQSQYAPDVVSGGEKLYLASNDILKIGRAKHKSRSGDFDGYTFKIKIEKSRSVREQAIIPFDVLFDGGIDRYTGLLELAKATGDAFQPTKGWWSRKFSDGREDEKFRLKAIDDDPEVSKAFFEGLLNETDFKANILKHYTYSGKPLSK